MPELDVRSIRGLASGDRLSDEIDQLPDEPETQQHPLDSDKMRREHRQMLEWWYLEREKQSANRLEMAIDADFTTTTSGITRIRRRSLTEAKCLSSTTRSRRPSTG